MPNFRFYDIEGDDTHKAIGAECYSPEEFQSWATALLEDVPAGSQLTVRTRKLPNGRSELLIGCVKIGKALLLKGEPTGDEKPLPPPAPTPLAIPDVVANADANACEVIYARAGGIVNEAWRSKSLPAKRADCAKKLRVQNAV